MNKLTQEQADWLYAKLYPPSNIIVTKNPEAIIEESIRIKEIINQCIEQEFPSIKLEWRLGDNSRQCVIITHVGECPFNILLDATMLAYFDIERFKEFTEGCNKIVQWIDAQNAG